MAKSLPQRAARKTRKNEVKMTPAMDRAMKITMTRIASIADKEARKDDKVQREARLAIAETLDAWLEWTAEADSNQAEEFFFELGCFATATNRRRLFKHIQMPDGVIERIQEQLDRWKAEEEAAKAEAEAEMQKGAAEKTEIA